MPVVLTGENGEPPQHRDIIVYPKDQPLRHTYIIHVDKL